MRKVWRNLRAKCFCAGAVDVRFLFVGRRCDRRQIYCVGICVQETRRDRRREAQRRYQATPRGRALHTERNRRYRTRQLQRVPPPGKEIVGATESQLSAPPARADSGRVGCHDPASFWAGLWGNNGPPGRAHTCLLGAEDIVPKEGRQHLLDPQRRELGEVIAG